MICAVDRVAYRKSNFVQLLTLLMSSFEEKEDSAEKVCTKRGTNHSKSLSEI